MYIWAHVDESVWSMDLQYIVQFNATHRNIIVGEFSVHLSVICSSI